MILKGTLLLKTFIIHQHYLVKFKLFVCSLDILNSSKFEHSMSKSKFFTSPFNFGLLRID